MGPPTPEKYYPSAEYSMLVFLEVADSKIPAFEVVEFPT